MEIFSVLVAWRALAFVPDKEGKQRLSPAGIAGLNQTNIIKTMTQTIMSKNKKIKILKKNPFATWEESKWVNLKKKGDADINLLNAPFLDLPDQTRSTTKPIVDFVCNL